MTQYNSLNVKLPNSQPNKLKSAIINETEVVVLRLSPNMIVDPNDEAHFPHRINCSSISSRCGNTLKNTRIRASSFLLLCFA